MGPWSPALFASSSVSQVFPRLLHLHHSEAVIEVPRALQDASILVVVLTFEVAMLLATSQIAAISGDTAIRTYFHLHDVVLDLLHELYLRESDEHVPRIYVGTSNPRVVGLAKDIYRNYFLVGNIPLSEARDKRREERTLTGMEWNAFNGQRTVFKVLPHGILSGPLGISTVVRPRRRIALVQTGPGLHSG